MNNFPKKESSTRNEYLDKIPEEILLIRMNRIYIYPNKEKLKHFNNDLKKLTCFDAPIFHTKNLWRAVFQQFQIGGSEDALRKTLRLF